MSTYIISMKFTVEKLPHVITEIEALEQSQKDMLEADYKKIQKTPKEKIKLAKQRLKEV